MINPQAFLNGYLSAMRNSIITIALGVSIYGFSRFFKKKNSQNTMKLVSVLPYIFSFLIMLNSVLFFRKYLESLTDEDIEELPKFFDFTMWKRYEYLGWFFLLITTILIFLSTKSYLVSFFE